MNLKNNKLQLNKMKLKKFSGYISVNLKINCHIFYFLV